MEFNIEKSIAPISYHLYDEDVALDVLLDMCYKKQVSIKEIFISDLTEQFIKYVASLEHKDYEEISSFLVLAATLLEIKSSELLPKIDFDNFDTNELSEADLFILRTEEYALFRDVANKLRDCEILNRFYREPEYDEREYKLVIKNFDLDKMVSAFASLLENVEFREDPTTPKTIPLERFTVVDRMKFITEYLTVYKKVKFIDFMQSDFSRIEIVNTFLAILELVKEQHITISQTDGQLKSIMLTHVEKEIFEQNNKEELFKNVEEYN